MNNLNEKLKLSLINSKKSRNKISNTHQIYPENNREKSFKKMIQRTCETIKSPSHSSAHSDDFESTNCSENDRFQSNEIFKSIQRRKLKQHLKKKERHVTKINNSSSTTTSNENEINSDECNSQGAKINSQNMNCKYCRSLTSVSKNDKDKRLFYSASKHPFNKGFIDYGIYSNKNRSKNGNYNEKIYAYDKFDYINECLNEENENQIIFSQKQKEQFFSKNNACIKNKNKEIEESQIETETDNEKCFSSILVEDGFIRMSSPVCLNEDFNRTKNLKKNEFNKIINQNNQMKNFSIESNCFSDKHLKNRNFAFKNFLEKGQSKEKETFPIVGSSPLPEAFFNSNEDGSDNEVNDTLENFKDIENLVKTNMRPDKSSLNKFLNMSQSDIDRLLESENFDFDGIIHYSRNPNHLNHEIVSLSDEDDIFDESDVNEKVDDDYDDNEIDLDNICTQYDNKKNYFDIESQPSKVQTYTQLKGNYDFIEKNYFTTNINVWLNYVYVKM